MRNIFRKRFFPSKTIKNYEKNEKEEKETLRGQFNFN